MAYAGDLKSLGRKAVWVRPPPRALLQNRRTLETALQILAIAGFAAVALRAVIALLASLRRGVDVFLARDLADTRRQRGDITGLTDAAEARAAASRQRL